MRCILSFCIALGFGWSNLSAQQNAPELSADEPLEFDAENNRLTARGNALLEHSNFRVEGQKIVFEQDQSKIKAKDNVAISRRDMRVVTDNANYDYFNRTFYTHDFRLGKFPIYIEGKEVTGTEDKVEVTDGRIYYHEPDDFSLNVAADNMTLENQRDLVMEDVFFQIGDVPFFYLPYAEYDMDQDMPFQYTGNIGYTGNLGFYWQNEIEIQVLKELRVGANIDGYTERGILGGPIIEYNWEDEDFGRMYGRLNTGFIYDEGSTSQLGVDVLGQPIQRNRNFIEWRHKQFAFEDDAFDFTSSISWWSDSEVERDFRPGLFDDNQVPDNFFNATYRGENWFLGAFARIQPNNWEVVAQRLPEVSFNLVPTELFETGVYQRLDASYVSLAENYVTGATPGLPFNQLDSNRLNAYYGLNMPLEVSDWMTVTPVAGVMTTFYGTTLGNSGSYTRVLGEIGIDLTATAVGRWQYENEFWGVDGLRHVLQPVVQYRYIPGAQAGSTVIPDIDRRASYDTYLEPIGLANKRNIDDLYEENVIRVGVENLFQTRDPEYGSRDLVELDFYQEFRFQTRPAQPARFGQGAQPPQQDFSDFFTVLSINPAYWLNFETLIRVDPNHLDLDEVTTGVTFRDGEKFEVMFGNNYIADVPGASINQFFIDTRYRLDSRNLIGGYWAIDARQGKLTEQVYLWETLLGNSWEFTFAIINRSGATRESSWDFQLSVSLVRI